MPKITDLKSLEQILVSHDQENPHYFLFMLGTDTQYTHRPTKFVADPTQKKYYENGETLSYVAQVVSRQLGELDAEINVAQPHSYSTPSVDVVNGPTTLGSEIGERIAQGIFLILHALAHGKTSVQIAAHSRGAAETILIAHELDRIQKELVQDPTKSLYKVLTNSPCGYTKAAFQTIYRETNESQEVRNKLAECLKTTHINMFLIDPVPGGRFRGIPWTAWRDNRFYTLPSANTTAELILCRDERTRCFIPVVPNGATVISMPGHHGTACGNLYTQQHETLPDTVTEKDTSLVQQLVVCKLLEFLNQHTGFLDPEAGPVDLSHPELDPLSNDFITTTNRSEKLLALYQTIHHNNNAYKYFVNTSYPVLLTEASPLGYRLIHFRGHNYTGLDSVVPDLDGVFINADHAHLYLESVMNFSMNDETNLVDMMSHLAAALSSLFIQYHNRDRTVNGLLNHPETRTNTFLALSLFIDNLSQRYLRNHLTVDVKTTLLTQLDQLFIAISSCKRLPEEDPINTIIAECETILFAGVKKTAETHYNSLVSQSNRLKNQAKQILISNLSEPQPTQALILEDSPVSEIDLLIEWNQLHENITNLIEGKTHISQLIGTLELAIDDDLLKQHIDSAVEYSAKLVAQLKLDLRVKPDYLSGDFFNRIKPQAIAHGATNPEVEALLAENQQAQEKIRAQDALRQQLLTPNETTCAHLINTKLMPLTEHYLLHLRQEAHRLNAQVSLVDSQEPLPSLAASAPRQHQSAYEKITAKYHTVQDLRMTLTDAGNNPLPSVRVDLFSQALIKEGHQLKAHRNSVWYQYLKNCMVAIGIVCTGIIPGILTLLAYSRISDRSSPLFFTKSQGEEYSDKIQKELLASGISP